LNSYHSVNSKKTNDTIKLLTVFSAFFLPFFFHWPSLLEFTGWILKICLN